MSDATNLADFDDTDSGEIDTSAEVETDQLDNTDDQLEGDADNGEDEENPSGDDDDTEYEEVERGDKRYKIPKALKDDLLRQDDYTRKTQVHSQEVARFEDRVKAFDLASEESLQAAVEAKAVKDRLSAINELSDADWNHIQQLDRQDGGDRYNKLVRELTSLPQKVAEAEGKSKAMREGVLKQQSEIQTKQLEQGQAILARDIPGWGPELGSKLAKFAMDGYGITEEKDGAAFMSPGVVKMAHELFRLKEAQRKTATVNKAKDATKNTPPRVARSAAPAAGLSDELSMDDWTRRRNEQVAKRH